MLWDAILGIGDKKRMEKQTYVQFMWEYYLDLLIVFLPANEDKVIISNRNGKKIQTSLTQGLERVKHDEEFGWCEKIGVVFKDGMMSCQQKIVDKYYPEAKIVDVTKYFDCQ